jgi:hypothetical protein
VRKEEIVIEREWEKERERERARERITKGHTVKNLFSMQLAQSLK